MNISTQILEFLRNNSVLNISQLEKEAGIPSKTLYKAMKDHQALSEKHCESLLSTLKKYGFKLNSQKAKVIAIVNHKGGVGKTTTTMNFGKALALLGKKVLLIDIDSQGNLSQSFGIDTPTIQVANALLDDQPLPAIAVDDNLFLAPSDLKLATREIEMQRMVLSELRLRKSLEPILDEYDFILIDCPPALNVFTANALTASNSCLITLQPEIHALNGYKGLSEYIMQIKRYSNSELRIEGVLLTLVDSRFVVHKEIIEQASKELSKTSHIYRTQIRKNVSLTESPISKMDIFSYDKNSIGATDYMNFTKEFLNIK